MTQVGAGGRLLLLAVLTVVTQSHAYCRNGKWGLYSNSTYPVVDLYVCANRLTQFLPEYPVDRLRYHLMAAANQWFEEGGAHLRVRYAGELSSGHPACDVGGTNDAPSGTIFLTAEQNSGARPCDDIAFGEFLPNGYGEIVKVV